MTRQATAAEIRSFYKEQGREVRITRDGHVTYRDEGETMWREGRWVEEYKVDDQFCVIL